MNTRRFLWVAVFCVGWLLSFDASPQIQPVSAPGPSVTSGGGNSFTPSLSGDGLFVVFVSQANNLVTNDNLDLYLDVFVRDLVNNRTALVSVNASGTGGGDASSNLPTISSNGQFIAFESAAANLAGQDTNRSTDVFVRDMQSGTTRLVSASTDGLRAGNGPSSNPFLTRNGRWVAFESAASDLVLDDTNGVTDVFIHDLITGTTRLVSVGLTNQSAMASITADGRFVAFVNTISNPSPSSLVWADIYVRDLQSNTTTKVTAELTNYFPNGQTPLRALNPVFSADAQFVAYKATPRVDSGAPARLLRYDMQARSTMLVSSNTLAVNPPGLSVDGRFVVYEGGTNIYVWDGQTGSNTLVSVNVAGTSGGNRASHTPVMTPDGAKVVFLSAASDLATNAVNGVSQIFVRDLVAGSTRLVSANLAGTASARDIDVTLPEITADGQFVAFESDASDFVTGDFNLANDVFVRDLDENLTQLVSQRHAALAPATGTAVSSTFPNSISADGRVVAFLSRDNNLTLDDTNGLPDAFVRDLGVGAYLVRIPSPKVNFSYAFVPPMPVVSANGRYGAFGQQVPDSGQTVWRSDFVTGTSVRVSYSESGTEIKGSAPTISGDGRLVAFESGITNVFLRDMEVNATQLISVNRFGTAAGNSFSTEPILSPDARWVLFASKASDLTTNNTGGARNLFARDLIASNTTLVSIGPDGSDQWGYVNGATFSTNSRYVAWVSGSSNILVTDLLNHTSVVVCANCERPSLTGDGHLVAYETRPTAAMPFRNVMIKDLRTGATSLGSVSRTGTGGNGHSMSPQISADGRFAVFASKASDLVENDTNSVSDIFVQDRTLGTTMLVTLNIQGTGAGNSVSTHPLMAADGRTVIFQSFASDLIAGDFNDRRDVFVLRLGAVDSDGDGLDDDWEMTYFGNLSRDGSGDFDGDEQTDRDEFLSGTNPTSDASLLRVMTLTSLNDGTTKILWSAVAGRTYRVQFKNSVDDTEWGELPADITASSSTACALDATASAEKQRFYRVVRLP